MTKAKRLPLSRTVKQASVTFGVCAPADPRIDQESRDRTVNIVETLAEEIGRKVKMPDGTSVNVVWAPLLIDGEKQADIVARQFRDANVDAVVCTPDTWAFPQLTLISLLAHMPDDMPINIIMETSETNKGIK